MQTAHRENTPGTNEQDLTVHRHHSPLPRLPVSKYVPETMRCAKADRGRVSFAAHPSASVRTTQTGREAATSKAIVLRRLLSSRDSCSLGDTVLAGGLQCPIMELQPAMSNPVSQAHTYSLLYLECMQRPCTLRSYSVDAELLTDGDDAIDPRH